MKNQVLKFDDFINEHDNYLGYPWNEKTVESFLNHIGQGDVYYGNPFTKFSSPIVGRCNGKLGNFSFYVEKGMYNRANKLCLVFSNSEESKKTLYFIERVKSDNFNVYIDTHTPEVLCVEMVVETPVDMDIVKEEMYLKDFSKYSLTLNDLERANYLWFKSAKQLGDKGYEVVYTTSGKPYLFRRNRKFGDKTYYILDDIEDDLKIGDKIEFESRYELNRYLKNN